MSDISTSQKIISDIAEILNADEPGSIDNILVGEVLEAIHEKFKDNPEKIMQITATLTEYGNSLTALSSRTNRLETRIRPIEFAGVLESEPELGNPDFAKWPVGSVVWSTQYHAFIELLPEEDWEHYNDWGELVPGQLFRTEFAVYIAVKDYSTGITSLEYLWGVPDAALPGRAVVTVEDSSVFWSMTPHSSEIPFSPVGSSGRWKALGYPQAGDVVEVRFEDDEWSTLEAVIAKAECYDDGCNTEYSHFWVCKLDFSVEGAGLLPCHAYFYQATPGSGELVNDSGFYPDLIANAAICVRPVATFYAENTASSKSLNNAAWDVATNGVAGIPLVQVRDDSKYYTGQFYLRTSGVALVSVNDGEHFRTYSITKAGDTVTVARVDNAEFNTEVASHVAPAYAAIQQLSKEVDAVFDELWRGCYDCSVNSANAEKPYTCNGLALTRAEAIAVYNSPRVTYNNIGGYTNLLGNPKTLILGSSGSTGDTPNINNAFCTESYVSLQIATTTAHIYSGSYAFNGCKNLERILGRIGLFYASTRVTKMFAGCVKLQEVQLYQLMQSVSFADSPLLSLASLQYMVENAANTSAITITVHPDVYAKLTDEAEELAPYVRPNLIADMIESSGGYILFQLLFGGLKPKAGQKMTFTLWGELGEGKTHFMIYNASDTTTKLANLTKKAEGVYFATFNWVDSPNPIYNLKGVRLYGAPSSVHSECTIHRIKLTFGEVEDDEWTPPIDAITDPELKERAQWVALVAEAESKNIQFATTE